MKKIGLSVLLPAILISSPAIASKEGNCPFDGIYTGISIGESIMMGDFDTFQSGALSVPAIAVNSLLSSDSAKPHLKKNALAADIFLGYGNSWDFLYLGLEAFAKGTKAKSSYTDIDSLQIVGSVSANLISNTTVKLRDGEYGLDLRPGVLFAPQSMLYGRIGAAFNKISLTSALNFTAQSSNALVPMTPVNTTLSHSRSKDIVALRLGIGLEQQFCANWSIRADYIYTHYRKISITNSITTTDFDPLAVGNSTKTITDSATARVFNNTVMLGLSYYW